LGVMDPTQRTGVASQGSIRGRYLYNSDVRALDIIGWDIYPNTVTTVAQVPVVVGPSGGITVGMIPTLMWTGSSGGRWDVSVFSGQQVGGGQLVFQVQDSQAQSVQIPEGILQGQSHYYWVVAEVSDSDFAVAGEAPFVTGPNNLHCSADFDGDGDTATDF